MQLRDAGVGPILTRLYPELVDPLAGYAATIPVIVAAIQVAIDRHTVNEQLTAVERAALADTLEAELE